MDEDLKYVENELSMKLRGALLGKTLNAFGDDGFGQRGQHPFAKFYKILDVDVGAYLKTWKDKGNTIEAQLVIRLEDYHWPTLDAITDQNLELSLTKLLTDAGMKRSDLEFVNIKTQMVYVGYSSMAFNLDVPSLMDWA